MNAARVMPYLFVAVAAVNSVRVAAEQPSDTRGGIPPVTDPVAKELEHCMQLGEEAAAKDEQCQAAHKKSLDQFFQPPKDYHPVPIQMNPGVPEPKLVKPDQTQSR